MWTLCGTPTYAGAVCRPQIARLLFSGHPHKRARPIYRDSYMIVSTLNLPSFDPNPFQKNPDSKYLTDPPIYSGSYMSFRSSFQVMEAQGGGFFQRCGEPFFKGVANAFLLRNLKTKTVTRIVAYPCKTEKSLAFLVCTTPKTTSISHCALA